jgi:alkylmercury lyase
MAQSPNTTAEKLWAAASQHFPEFSPEQQRVALTLLQELLGGDPVPASRLGTALGIDEGEAARYLAETSLRPFVYPGDGAPVKGFWGLLTVPTSHEFVVNGRALWASCAVDSLFLPQLLDVTASIASTDPVSGEAVALRVTPDFIETHRPDDIAVSMSSPDAWDATSALHLMLTACHTTHFFASPETGARWTASHPKTILISLEEAFVYGQRQNRETFGHQLSLPSTTGR